MQKPTLHLEILSEKQLRQLKIVQSFKRGYYLVGGTAIALQIGHRRSIDFDLFSDQPFDNKRIIGKLRDSLEIERIFISSQKELTLVASGVKWTFYTFPFEIPPTVESNFARMPDLLTLAAMKAFALGGRGKWKDYLDLYYLSKQFSLQSILDRATELFGSSFNQKLLRAQLSYFDDVSHKEIVDFMPGFAVPDEEVKNELTRIALE